MQWRRLLKDVAVAAMLTVPCFHTGFCVAVSEDVRQPEQIRALVHLAVVGEEEVVAIRLNPIWEVVVGFDLWVCCFWNLFYFYFAVLFLGSHTIAKFPVTLDSPVPRV